MHDQHRCADSARIHTIHLPTFRCSSRGQPIWIVTRLLQESHTSNTHACTMGTKRQCASPRPSLNLYHFARLVRHCAKQSDRNSSGYISKPSIYKTQRNLRIRASRKYHCQLSSVSCSTYREASIRLLIGLLGQRWSNIILPY